MSDEAVVGVTEVAAILSVTRQRVYQLAEAYPDFPAPMADLSRGRLWSRRAIEKWRDAHNDRYPGTRLRPPASA